MLGNIFRRIVALPAPVKVVLALVALIALGMSVALSPVVVAVTILVLVVAVLALLIQLLRREWLRRWGIVATASLLPCPNVLGHIERPLRRRAEAHVLGRIPATSGFEVKLPARGATRGGYR
jgi:hypothetical protein